jgi:phosphohistidine phosphatase
MELLVIRHAEALPVSQKHPTDESRPLSASGERTADAVGRHLREAGLLPDRILASPLVRAAQTAERIARGAGIAAPSPEPRLAPGGAAWDLVVELSRKNGRIAIVGHEPTTSALVGRLLGGAAVSFRPASLAHLEITRGATEAILHALLPPPQVTKGR